MLLSRHTRRREFIAALGGAAAWPLTARGQPGERVRRIGVLLNLAAEGAESQRRLSAFLNGLQELGWVDGRNIQIDMRWAGGDVAQLRKYAMELVALGPDAILAWATPAVTQLRELSGAVPIVFVAVIDPVGSGLVGSMARPGGNVTGFVNFEYALAAKWLELLKEIAPATTRVAVLRDPTVAAGVGQFAAVQTVAPVGLDLTVIDMHDADDIERAVAKFAGDPNGGLIVTASQFGGNHPDVIARISAKHKLPAVYPFRYFAQVGGLLSYGADQIDEFHRAASYVDRILRGARPSDLPVQAPIKYELVINLKSAMALGVQVPRSLIARADELIE